MTVLEAQVRQLLVSFISEERLGKPGRALEAATRAAEADPEHKASHLANASIAALLAGEPKRALRLLDAAATDGGVPARVDALVRSWAWQLNSNSYPGGIGAELADAPPPAQPAPGEELDELSLLEHVVADGPPLLASVRTTVESMVRIGAQTAAEQLIGEPSAGLAALASRLEAGPTGSGMWAHLARADLSDRARLKQAPLTWDETCAATEQAGRAETIALMHLITGDRLLTPGSSPESLGFSLAPESGQPPARPAPDPVGAIARYDAAERALGSLDAPRLTAALHLRRAMALGLQTPADHERRRDLLTRAVALYEDSGDAMGAHLAAAHRLLVDVDAGALYVHALDLGAGWQPPKEGPIGQAVAWAEHDGSTSWCVGIGRLCERAAQSWAARGESARARVAYLASLPLVRLNPSLPSRTIVVALADMDTRTNLASRGLIRLERLATQRPEAVTPFGAGEWLEAAYVTLGAHRARARGAAAEYSARAMLRLRAKIADIASSSPNGFAAPEADKVESADDALDAASGIEALFAGFDNASAAFASTIAAFADDLVTQLDVFVPLARAELAQRTGRPEDAHRWHEQAIAKASVDGAAAHLRPLALIGAERFDEARDALRDAVAAQSLPDEFVVTLGLRARDPSLARAAASRLDQTDGRRIVGWSELLDRAELFRAEGNETDAAAEAARAIASFEELVAPLLRDPDRLAAYDQPDVAALYLLMALLRHQAGDDDGSLEVFEQARAITWAETAEPTHDRALWRTWQQCAAEWGILADRALVQIDRQQGGLTSEMADELDRADDRLAQAEHDLDSSEPGVLLRRTKSAPPRLQQVRERLDDNTVVLEYGAMGDDLLGWAVTNSGINVTAQVLPYRRLASMVRSFHRSCASGRAGDGQPFTDLLLAPFTRELASHRRVIIVPFGPLNLLPFHALELKGQALGDSHVVSYAPTVTIVGRAGPVDESIVPTTPLVVGDPAFDTGLRPGLRRLPGAEVEARAAAARLGMSSDRVLLDTRATELEVTEMLRTADLVHFAAHGLLDEYAPFASSLVLAGHEELTVADLVGLTLSTPLAVLSGCDTGRGAATLGGDVVGLTRSLLRSGVRQAVVSLWPVDDRIAPLIMDEFYRGLIAGTPPAHALAGAQGALRRLSVDALNDSYVALGGQLDTSDNARRRSAADLLLDPELRDDEPLAEPLDGTAERYWAPYILVGG